MREFHVINLGAGVQSTMLYLLAVEKHPVMPPIDFAIFADVGEEPQAVYDHLEWLKGLGGPEILVRSKGKMGDDLRFGQQSRTGKTGRPFACIPAFTENGGMGMRQCTAEYKIEVINQTIRRDILGLKPRKHVPKDVHVHQYLGLSFDEARRVANTRKRFMEVRWATGHFPLFETNTDRAGAKKWLSGRVPHEVPRSSCVFCPFHSQAEWQAVRAVRADWERACEIDEALRSELYVCSRGMRERQFVHRSCVPLREADLSTPDETGEFGFCRECEGMCGV